MPGRVLMIATLDVHDPATMEKCERLASPHETRLLAIQFDSETLRGAAMARGAR
jgi:hypothetical protein